MNAPVWLNPLLRCRPRPFRAPVTVSAGWRDADNRGADDWENEGGLPDVPDPDDGDYRAPPGIFNPDATFKRKRLEYAHKASEILNGCTRCKGSVRFRRKDGARYCASCDRTFYPDFAKMAFKIAVYVPPDTEE